MSNPFRDPSLWVRMMAFSAAILGISLGLCGLNIGASALFSASGTFGGAHGSVLTSVLSPLLSITGILEICGIAIGAAGIALSGVALFIKLLWVLVNRKG